MRLSPGLELARLGEQPVAEMAKELGIPESCLRNWMAQADADDGTNGARQGRLSADERAGLTEFRKKTKRLQVLEIVKRAHRPTAPCCSWSWRAWRRSSDDPYLSVSDGSPLPVQR